MNVTQNSVTHTANRFVFPKNHQPFLLARSFHTISCLGHIHAPSAYLQL
ncbi:MULTISPECIES: hypothetical protein [Nostocales]|uniref:Uncharacterized protein n=3 Tax=Nostocales TaxID=1161 RepID=A0A8S9TBH2_9CYAN|nr:hypothetical protein [Tolypothrix bouteillei]KAF3889448.1 hypothetical protein DA73_0400031180 [Tolypothrix bouteillei VB521301]